MMVVRRRWPWLRHRFAGSAYDRGKLMSAAACHDFMTELGHELSDQFGFQVRPRHREVERTSPG
jgi:hypothetical protein